MMHIADALKAFQPHRGDAIVVPTSFAAIGRAVGGACCSRPKPSNVSSGGSVPSPTALTPWLIATTRRSISTKRPDSARLDHSALAVVVVGC